MQRFSVRGAAALAAFALIVTIVVHKTAVSTLGQQGDQGESRIQSRGSETRGGSSTRSTQSFESKLWRYLEQVRYHNWATGPGKNGETYKGQSPHGAFLRLYLNRTAAEKPQEMPQGSIIIKENFGTDGETLMAVTVMYRTPNYDPEHNNWYWVKFNPDGTVAHTPAEEGSKRIAGRFPGCIECHAGADGGDYVFAND